MVFDSHFFMVLANWKIFITSQGTQLRKMNVYKMTISWTMLYLLTSIPLLIIISVKIIIYPQQYIYLFTAYLFIDSDTYLVDPATSRYQQAYHCIVVAVNSMRQKCFAIFVLEIKKKLYIPKDFFGCSKTLILLHNLLLYLCVNNRWFLLWKKKIHLTYFASQFSLNL